MTADQPTPDVETVLAAHANDGSGDCICTEYVLDVPYAAHVAAVLEPLIREREAKAWDEGYSDGHDDEANAHYDLNSNPHRAATHRTKP